MANAVDGADFSLFIELPVAGTRYWILAREIDIDAEAAVAEREAEELEREATHVAAGYERLSPRATRTPPRFPARS